jgi:hypothetical protein
VWPSAGFNALLKVVEVPHEYLKFIFVMIGSRPQARR